MQQTTAVEGYEARYLVQSPKYRRGGLVVRAPNADLGRDPRWGRTEECYGEDPYFNGTMTQAFVRGLQGDDPRCWQSASLMKHFLANSLAASQLAYWDTARHRFVVEPGSAQIFGSGSSTDSRLETELEITA